MPRKKRVALDLLAAVRAEALRGVALEERGDHALRLGRHVGREEERVLQDPLVHHVHVLVVERGEAGLGVGGGQRRGQGERVRVGVGRGREGRGREREGRTIISYRSTPSVHQSTVFVYPCDSSSSGAMYSGVPQNAERTHKTRVSARDPRRAAVPEAMAREKAEERGEGERERERERRGGEKEGREG